LEPSFGWVSLAPKALARARAQLSDGGQGVRDEIGLGQPNQEDLLENLAKSAPALLATLRSLMLELCPFQQQTDPEARA